MSRSTRDAADGHRITRRKLLETASAAGVGIAGFSAVNFLLPKTSRGQDKMTDQLVISTWGGSFADGIRAALVEPFQAETGVKVAMSVTGNPAEMLAKLKAATVGGAPSEIDVMWNDLSFSYSAITQGLVEPLRLDNIPSYKSALPLFNKLEHPVSWDPGEEVHGAPAEYVPRGMGYSGQDVERALDSVEELWNPEWDQRIGIYSNTQWMMANAAFLTGQDPNAIEDLDLIWERLGEQAKLVKRYFSNWAEGMELYQNGTIWVSPFLGGRAVNLRERGYDIRYVRPKEGWLLNADMLLIGKGSRNRLTAEKFIEFSYRPEVVTQIAELTGYPQCSSNLQPTEKVTSLPDYDPTGELAGVLLPDPAYWDEHMSEWTEVVNGIMAG